MNTDRFADFSMFVDKEILPAANDIEKLDDSSRKHVQKLVYTNLVDRFDAMIDGALLDNCREEHLVSEATKVLTKPITESDLLQLLIHSDHVQDALDIKLKESLRNVVLRERHSRKLSTLFRVFQPDQECWNQPRVNISVGTISPHIKPQKKTIPYSICGYADWLYSRRNSIVHGAGTNKFLANDAAQLEKLFKCKPAKTFRIRVSSTRISAAFYKGVVDLLMGVA